MALARRNPEALEEPKHSDALELPRKVTPKSQWPARAQIIIDRLRDEYDDLTAFVLLKQMSEILVAAIDAQCERAMMATPGKKAEVMGCIAELRNLPTKYEYEDPRLDSLLATLASVKSEIKARQEFLESLKVEQILPGGEIVKPAKKVSTGVTLAITFPKYGGIANG